MMLLCGYLRVCVGDCVHTCPLLVYICVSRFQRGPGTEILKYSFCLISSNSKTGSTGNLSHPPPHHAPSWKKVLSS